MNMKRKNRNAKLSRNVSKLAWTGCIVAMGALGAAGAYANHPVLVEGNCFGPGQGATATGLQTVPPVAGTCGDYDGDGLIGTDEDNDGDNNFGSIGAALAAVAQNGRVTIVTSGTFAEGVTINPMDGGNVTLEAAPGVDANIDAVVQGNAGSGARQGAPGIVIDGCASCRVTVRNVMTRNWTEGVRIVGHSHATLDAVRAENNLKFGIRATYRARVAISDSDINATGFRKGGAGVGTPHPGIGIAFQGGAKGSIYNTSVTGSFAQGIVGRVKVKDVQTFDNGDDDRRGKGRY